MAVPLRVLILEAQPADAELMLAELRQAGFAPDWQRVDNEADYLSHLDSKPDLILADYSMPQLDGLRALRLLQAREVDIPLILVSGSIGEDLAVAAVRHGAADCVLKGQLTRLGSAIVHALEQKRLRDEKRQAEEALQRRERELRTLSDNVPDLIVRFDRQLRHLYINRQIERLTGMPVQAFIGKTDRELDMPEDLVAFWEESLLGVFERGEINTIEFILPTHNGERYLEARLIPEFAADRSVDTILSIVRDVTPRKQMEEALRASEARLRRLFEADVIGIFFTSANKNNAVITEANNAFLAFLRMTGYSQEDLRRGQVNWERMTPPAYRFLDERAEEELRRFGVRTPYEKEYCRKDNSRVPAVLGGALMEEDPKVCVAFALDITDRKRAEEALREEAQISAALARVGRELIVSLDTPAILDRLCQLITEVVGCDCSHSLLWHPQENGYVPMTSYGHLPEQWEAMRTLKLSPSLLADLLGQLEREQIATLEVATMQDLPIGMLAQQYGLTHVLYVALQRGTEIIGIQTAAYRERQEPFTQQQRRILQGIGQLASLALEDARLLEEVHRANRLKSDFLATMSHELRTPLNIVMGYIDLLLDEGFGTLTVEQHDVLRRVRKAAAGELELITAMLDVSRLEAGRLLVEVNEVQLPALLNELVADAQDLLQGKPEVALTWQVTPEVSSLHTDRVKLRTVLKNLLHNAIKFTEAGKVEVEAARLDGGIEFRVSDTGVGIALEVKPVLFEMFRQGESPLTRHYGGVGLGLYIVSRFLEILGGRVTTVESEIGQGSTFRVWVPQMGAPRVQEGTASVSH